MDLMRVRYPHTRRILVTGNPPAGSVRTNLFERYGLDEIIVKSNLDLSSLGTAVEAAIAQGLRDQLTLREQELDLLHAVDLHMLEAEQSDADIIPFVLQRTREMLRASHCSILLRRSAYLEVTYSTLTSAQGQRILISDSIAGKCLATGAAVTVSDLTTSPLAASYQPLHGYRGRQLLSLLATPITLSGISIGVLNIESARPHAFKPEHERISSSIAAQVAIVLRRIQMFDSRALSADMDSLIFASDDSEPVIQTALERVMSELQRLEYVQHSGAQILFLRNQDELEIVHSTNSSDIGLTVPVDKSVSGHAVRERRTVTVSDVGQNSEYSNIRPSIRSEIAIPILFGEDNIAIGALNVESEEPDAFNGFNQVVLENFSEKVKTLLAFAKLRSDVTEALEIRSANDLLLAIGDQTSHMIHRLNNTVGAMRFRILELQDLQEDGRLFEDPEFVGDSLAALRELAERALRMPEEITLMLSQGDIKIDANECVRRAVSATTLPENISLSLDLEDGIPPLQLYSFDIVVQNLLQNGIDAMPSGGRLSVSTCAVLHPKRSAGYFQLTVTDTGVGISPDIQRRIFDLNFTTKHGKGKGLGLGLWWVRNFVRRTGGDITIRSALNCGTEAIVKIPIRESDEIDNAGLG